jgi:hypothetical protein
MPCQEKIKLTIRVSPSCPSCPVFLPLPVFCLLRIAFQWSFQYTHTEHTIHTRGLKLFSADTDKVQTQGSIPHATI